jgi:4-hydroxy-L-threonine phosphate dehydrogenase PdxA
MSHKFNASYAMYTMTLRTALSSSIASQSTAVVTCPVSGAVLADADADFIVVCVADAAVPAQKRHKGL